MPLNFFSLFKVFLYYRQCRKFNIVQGSRHRLPSHHFGYCKYCCNDEKVYCYINDDIKIFGVGLKKVPHIAYDKKNSWYIYDKNFHVSHQHVSAKNIYIKLSTKNFYKVNLRTSAFIPRSTGNFYIIPSRVGNFCIIPSRDGNLCIILCIVDIFCILQRGTGKLCIM